MQRSPGARYSSLRVSVFGRPAASDSAVAAPPTPSPASPTRRVPLSLTSLSTLLPPPTDVNLINTCEYDDECDVKRRVKMRLFGCDEMESSYTRAQAAIGACIMAMVLASWGVFIWGELRLCRSSPLDYTRSYDHGLNTTYWIESQCYNARSLASGHCLALGAVPQGMATSGLAPGLRANATVLLLSFGPGVDVSLMLDPSAPLLASGSAALVRALDPLHNDSFVYRSDGGDITADDARQMLGGEFITQPIFVRFDEIVSDFIDSWEYEHGNSPADYFGITQPLSWDVSTQGTWADSGQSGRVEWSHPADPLAQRIADITELHAWLRYLARDTSCFASLLHVSRHSREAVWRHERAAPPPDFEHPVFETFVKSRVRYIAPFSEDLDTPAHSMDLTLKIAYRAYRLPDTRDINTRSAMTPEYVAAFSAMEARLRADRLIFLPVYSNSSGLPGSFLYNSTRLVQFRKSKLEDNPLNIDGVTSDVGGSLELTISPPLARGEYFSFDWEQVEQLFPGASRMLALPDGSCFTCDPRAKMVPRIDASAPPFYWRWSVGLRFDELPGRSTVKPASFHGSAIQVTGHNSYLGAVRGVDACAGDAFKSQLTVKISRPPQVHEYVPFGTFRSDPTAPLIPSPPHAYTSYLSDPMLQRGLALGAIMQHQLLASKWNAADDSPATRAAWRSSPLVRHMLCSCEGVTFVDDDSPRSAGELPAALGKLRLIGG